MPGWQFAAVYYHTSVSAGADVARAREIKIGRFTPTVTSTLSARLNADADLVFLNPTYVFATPVLGGQASMSMLAAVGRSSADVNGTLTVTAGPLTLTRFDSISDSVFGFGDLIPQASIKWNQGVNNFMVYGTGDIPVGTYNSTQLANLGIGHGVRMPVQATPTSTRRPGTNSRRSPA